MEEFKSCLTYPVEFKPVLTIRQWKNALRKLGYKYRPTHMRLMTNGIGEHGWCMPSLIEIDTGLTFASPNARRDDNYRVMQKMRRTVTVIYKDCPCWI